MLLKIGLTGGIASGKSTASGILEKLGVPVLDADVAVRELSQSGTPAFDAIKALLGPEFVEDNHRLDRQKIREVIFSDDAKRQALEAILHPAVRKWLLAGIDAIAHTNKVANKAANKTANDTAPYCVLVIPLLVESNMADLADLVAVIDCDEELQIERLTARDHCDEAHARQILHKQTDRQRRLAAADIIIENNGSLEDLERQILSLHKRWENIAQQRAR